MKRSQNVPVNSCSDEMGTPWSRLESAMPQSRGMPDCGARVEPRPERAPAWALGLAAPLEGDDPDDQEHEQEQQRDVEAREHGRVPDRERGERGRPGDDRARPRCRPRTARSPGSSCRRSSSLRPSTGSSMPTPKSKPSVTKYSDQSAQRIQNQVVCISSSARVSAPAPLLRSRRPLQADRAARSAA